MPLWGWLDVLVMVPFDLDAARTYLGKARQQRVADRRIQLAITTDGHTPLGEILLFRTDQDQAAELPYVDHPALSTHPG